jgi:hypothetical protein
MKTVRSDLRFDPKVVANFGDPVYNGLPDTLPTVGRDYDLFAMIIITGSVERKYVRPLFTQRHLEELWDLEFATPFHFIVYQVPKFISPGRLQPR